MKLREIPLNSVIKVYRDSELYRHRYRLSKSRYPERLPEELTVHRREKDTVWCWAGKVQVPLWGGLEIDVP